MHSLAILTCKRLRFDQSSSGNLKSLSYRSHIALLFLVKVAAIANKAVVNRCPDLIDRSDVVVAVIDWNRHSRRNSSVCGATQEQGHA